MTSEEIQAILVLQWKNITDAFDRTERKYDKYFKTLRGEINELTHSLEYTQAMVDEIKSELR